MKDTLLDIISKYSNSTIISNSWLTGQTGEIVDVKGDCIFRFVEYIHDETGIREKHITVESKLSCPIVACGIVGYWLHHKDNTGTKAIFEDYFEARLQQYVKLHKCDSDAWKRDLKKEFIINHHIPAENILIKTSEALFSYVTENDQNTIIDITSNYLEFVSAKSKEIYSFNSQNNAAVDSNQNSANEKIFKQKEEFDAWVQISCLIKNAKKRICLIDGYIDESVLSLFTKCDGNVTVTIYSNYNQSLKTDLDKYNRQYKAIDLIQFNKAVHDRFLIVDDDVYHLGASLKDFGRRLCTIIKMSISPENIISLIT